MTADLTVPIRWVEGHLSQLDDREAAADHAWRAALTDEDRALRAAEIEQVLEDRRAWAEVLRRLQRKPPRHRARRR